LQEKDCQKKGVQKLSEGSERFFAYQEKDCQKKRSAKIKRGQRAIFCFMPMPPAFIMQAAKAP